MRPEHGGRVNTEAGTCEKRADSRKTRLIGEEAPHEVATVVMGRRVLGLESAVSNRPAGRRSTPFYLEGVNASTSRQSCASTSRTAQSTLTENGFIRRSPMSKQSAKRASWAMGRRGPRGPTLEGGRAPVRRRRRHRGLLGRADQRPAPSTVVDWSITRRPHQTRRTLPPGG